MKRDSTQWRMPTLPGHHRNVSQGQHLIVDRNESGDEDDTEHGRVGILPGENRADLNTSPHYLPQNNKPNCLPTGLEEVWLSFNLLPFFMVLDTT
ncbi:hypothetical protein DICVIV_03961 [Dictyocaulus viviparus]|uniref:Uncharacterized protein n=1 Tax=Dictyocaulus viviparus TaxID=29172 RepID=A0A0D8Y5T5_DICVI|nr:hypothetical protein DICVIV_03961 [Dictyocaulus viviparus]